MTEADGKQWYSVAVTVAPEAAEAIEYAFNSLESIGSEINYLQHKLLKNVIVVGYFNAQPDEERVQDELHYALRIHGFGEEAVQQLERTTIEDNDWLAEWKKHWKPTQIANFVIAPPWGDIDEDGRIVIRIEPNMAFGTGTHETTQLCLRAIAEHYAPGDSLLDVGTGTGILAIAAAKINLKSEISNFTLESDLKSEISDLNSASALKSQISNFKSEISNLEPASDLKSEISNLKSEISDLISASALKSQISSFKLIACDTDPDAVSLARENAELNGVDGLINFHVGTIPSDGAVFDFVCANLTLDVIMPILPVLLSTATKTLVLSGILTEQKDEIVRALRPSNFEIVEAGEWIRVVVDKH